MFRLLFFVYVSGTDYNAVSSYVYVYNKSRPNRTPEGRWILIRKAISYGNPSKTSAGRLLLPRSRAPAEWRKVRTRKNDCDRINHARRRRQYDYDLLLCFKVKRWGP